MLRNFFSLGKSAQFPPFSCTIGRTRRSSFQSDSDLGTPVHSTLPSGADYSPSASEGVGPLIHEGDTVRFQVADIFLPAADDLPKSFTSADQLEGTVVNFSDSGSLPHVFAVVDVIAHHSVIIPVEKLQLPEPRGTPNAL